MLLGEVTDEDYDGGGTYLRANGIPKEDLHEEFEEYVVQKEAKYK
jgi:hypothetical protein